MNINAPQEKIVQKARESGLPALFVKRHLRRAVWASLWMVAINQELVECIIQVLLQFKQEEDITFERWTAGNLPPAPSLDTPGQGRAVHPARSDKKGLKS